MVRSKLAWRHSTQAKVKRLIYFNRGRYSSEIRVPDPCPRTSGVYLKYSLREAVDFAVAGVAVVITLKPEERICSDARIVMGSVASSPVRVVEAENIIRGREVNDKLVEDVEQVALKEVRPITHMGIPAGYKRRIVGTLIKRAVRQASQQAKI